MLRWKQVGSGDIGCETFGDNALDELGDKRQVGNWTIRIGEIRIDWRILEKRQDTGLFKLMWKDGGAE